MKKFLHLLYERLKIRKEDEKMVKKIIVKSVLITVTVTLTAFIGMFATDSYRAGHLMEPIFARPVSLTTGYGIGYDLYKGIGYTVETQTYTEKGSEKRLVAVTMYIGDKTVSASIT